ncbi:MAG TPA: ABC transporter permease [Bryobacteraceae bacterium]|nr:ABC transporter permease [Bryobacteraceae bacterium]
MDLFQDFRYSIQQLRRSPGFTATAVLSLALGIAATTAVFSVVYAILLDPYPYAHPEQMAHLVLIDDAGHERWPGLNGPELRQIAQVKSLQSVVAFDEWNLTTTGGDIPDDVTAYYFTSNATSFFGVPPLMGRGLLPSDAPYGQDPQPVVVLNYKFWQRHFGGAPDVVGKPLQLVHKTYTVVGVMPERFTWGDADLYLPLKVSNNPKAFYGPTLRLKPGVTHEAADAELQPLMMQFAKDMPDHFPKKFRVRIQGLNDHFIKRLGGTLYMLLAAVAMLLVIGCANVSILLLARGTARRHELAVRAAIGARRGRLVRQLLTEALVLAVAGASLGILLAWKSVALIVRFLPEGSFPHEAAIHLNVPVLLFSTGLALLTGILFGLSPALQLSNPELANMLQSSTRRLIGGVHGRRTHNVLVGAQIALTLVLLTAAGAAMQAFLTLMHAPLGYDPNNVMSVGIPVHDNTYTNWQARATYFDQLRRRIAAMPQVTMAGISSNATPPWNGFQSHFELMGRSIPDQQQARVNLIGPEYFEVLHIALLQGRLWDQAETMRGARLAVINATMARQYWPNGSAIGQQVRIPDMKPSPPYVLNAPGSNDWMQIIGVVADARNQGLREPIKPSIYVPFTTQMYVFTQILVRSTVPPLSILRAVRAEVMKVDPDQQVIGNVRDLNGWITNQPEWAQGRMVAILFGGFAILALALAATGLYSVVSYSVAQRTNEFGVRMALGANRTDVLRLVFASTGVSIGGGLLAGLVLSVAASRLIATWVEGSSRSPLILLAVVAVLAGAAAVASFLPARRASAVDPMCALRYE